MLMRPRVLPCLLLKGAGLVKTRQFKNPVYLGEPINILRIFNDKEVDEMVLLDIEASKNGQGPQFELLARVATECFMPLAYGGGIRTLGDIERILTQGFEKVVLNTSAVLNPGLIREAAAVFGSQAIVVSIDVKKGFFGKSEVLTRCGTQKTGLDPVTWAKRCEEFGAGEILVTSIAAEGGMQGYDLSLVRSVADAVSVPVIASGGAGKVEDFRQAVSEGGASAVAAGSFFVFQGVHRAVLITVPSEKELEGAFAR